MTEVQAGYLLIVNAVTFLVFGIDKKRAKKNSGECLNERFFCLLWQEGVSERWQECTHSGTKQEKLNSRLGYR